MFTGIIKLLGVIDSVNPLTDGVAVGIACDTSVLDIDLGDSIAVNGVCSTVVAFTDTHFIVHYLQETLRVTTFNTLTVGSYVNLEPSLTLQTKLSGHYVSGHIDGVGKIIELEKSDPWGKIVVSFEDALSSFLIYKGSIAIDGISLTISHLSSTSLTCHIIPHTFEQTVINYYDIGKEINIECDMIGKYVVNAVKSGSLGNING
ncbi:riboflavin synthase [bacterium]|nr:riboflavin synthase [bacterium]|tara:strand:- start:1155 stop:1766 length:612 start_codon:yes stop_codon:yes gene_type:complete